MADDIDLRTRIDVFAKNQCSLLDIELEEEKKEFQYDVNAPEIGLLEKKGLLINNLQISNVLSEFGACVVEFERTSARKDSNPSPFRQGDIVSVWLSGAEADNKKTYLSSGTVVQCSDDIRLSFDHSVPFEWDVEKTSYFIIKTASSVTFKRLKKGLRSLKKHLHGRSYPVIKILIGEAELEKIPLHPDLLNERGQLTFFNKQLHKSQKKVVKFCLEQKHLAIVHGPPGTGKTTVLVEVILQLVSSGQKVLVCAPSNIAVDVYVEKLKLFKMKVIRMGKSARMVENAKDSSIDAIQSKREESSILKTVKKEMTDNQKKLNNADCCDKGYIYEVLKGLKSEFFVRHTKMMRSILENADVILSTLLSASEDGDLKYLPRDYFDVVIIDECSQAIEAACWIVIPRAPKIILAGDPLQLPPTIKSQYVKDNGLGISLMERAMIKLGKGYQKLLHHQFRMNSAIMDWVNNTFYESKLVADKSVANCVLKDLPNIKETQETVTPLLLVDTAGFADQEEEFDGSKFNEAEGDLVAVLAKRLIDAGVHENDIAVITPYSMQVVCIKMKISNYPDVEVRTVDGFQGREKKAVILSLVRANNNSELGFLTDARRLNVAVSRAQFFLAVVGNSLTVRREKILRDFWNYLEDRGIFYSAYELSKDIEQLNLPHFTVRTHKPQKKKCSKSSREKHPKGKQNYPGTNEVSAEQEKVRPAMTTMDLDVENASSCIKETSHLEKLMTSDVEKSMAEDSEAENNITDIKNDSLGTDTKDLPEGKSKHNSRTFRNKMILESDPGNTHLGGPGESYKSEIRHSSRYYYNTMLSKSGPNKINTEEEHWKSETSTRQVRSPSVEETNPLAVRMRPDEETVSMCENGAPENILTSPYSGNTFVEAFDQIGQNSRGAVAKHISKEKPKSKPNKNQTSSTCASFEAHILSDNNDSNEKAVFKSNTNVENHNDKKKYKSKMSTTHSKDEKEELSQTKSKNNHKNSDHSNHDMKILDNSIKRNSSCQFQECKTTTSWLLAPCNHCRENFCFHHLQPEVHGCGEAAKLEARQNFKTERLVDKSVKKDRELAKRKLKIKVAQSASERKPKPKSLPKK